MTDLSKEQLRHLSVMGVTARLEELRSEEAAIRQAFPELGRETASSGRSEEQPDVAGGPAGRV